MFDLKKIYNFDLYYFNNSCQKPAQAQILTSEIGTNFPDNDSNSENKKLTLNRFVKI